MVQRSGPEDSTVVLKFGGGVHSRASADGVNPREAVSGQNFILDLENHNLRPRPAFDLVGTVPSSGDMTINGFASHLKADGTVSFLVQAGTDVLDWDGTSSFTSKGTVLSGTKMRGWLHHNWQLDGKVIITDLALVEPVMEYDGTTFQNITFTKNDGSTAWTGDFIAKYCVVDNERVVFFNIKDNGSLFPHLIVGSKRGDFTIISNDQRPSSALSDEDPFFLIQPDFRSINGAVGAFGIIATSSDGGDIFRFTGTSAKDFAMSALHPRSGADGDESLVFSGNDILYGRAGRIESLSGVEQFGDTETNDLSIPIADQIEDYSDWTSIYNSRLQRVHFFASGQQNLFTLHKSLVGSDVSPWSQWVTAHGLNFQPTAVMNMLDPADSLEYIFMGDSSGNIYRLEGSGSSGDGGSGLITTEYLTHVISIPIGAEAFNIDGWIRYKRLDAVTVKLNFEYAGYQVFDQAISIDIPAVPSVAAVYNDQKYYNDGNYYGSAFRARLTRQRFAAAGRGTDFQVRIKVESNSDFEISEIGLKFTAAT